MHIIIETHIHTKPILSAYVSQLLGRAGLAAVQALAPAPFHLVSPWPAHPLDGTELAHYTPASGELAHDLSWHTLYKKTVVYG